MSFASRFEQLPSKESPMRIAILDDYQSVALKMADWSPLEGKAEISVFSDYVADEDTQL
jgi:hypothetical protein